MSEAKQETPREHVQKTFRKILEQTTLRAILRPLGRTPLDVTQVERDDLLEPYKAAIDADEVMCKEVADQLLAIGLSTTSLEEHITAEQGPERMHLSTEEE